jgi:glutathione S-transferase
MKLYYSPGACSVAAHVALREADRQFELERVDLKSHRTATGTDYRLVNPKGYVPALQLDGPHSPVLTENIAILQYIADLAPDRNLAPSWGTFARYHLQEWLAFVSTELHKQFSPLFSPDIPAPTAARARDKISERLRYVDGELAERSFLMGETFTVADCYLFAILRWCDRFEVDMLQWQNVHDYFVRLGHRPTVQAALEAEGLVERKRVRRSA